MGAAFRAKQEFGSALLREGMAEAGWELPKSRPCTYPGARGPCAAGRHFPAQSQDPVSQEEPALPEEPASPTPRAGRSHAVQKLTLNSAPCLSGSATSGLRARRLLPARLHHPEHFSLLLRTSRCPGCLNPDLQPALGAGSLTCLR